MLIFDVEQGSPEWFALRLGVPTASNFGKIITPGGVPSLQSQSYMNKLISELIVGDRLESFTSPAMQHGIDTEPLAVAAYEKRFKVTTKEVGFITIPSGRIGCSPDRFVGKDGLLEIKCPSETTHKVNLSRKAGTIDPKYIPQVQGQILLSRREWCDWVSFCLPLRTICIRVERDEEYLSLMTEMLAEFIYNMNCKIDILKSKGVKFKIDLRSS